ncbi:MAG: hypothetical protein KME55_39115 [Nostoc indistinguendum CM1-VF10]|jgi:hypothetical protein|nr:hypothetical protein [Nostoc indistinguendum CM1-VF10]
MVNNQLHSTGIDASLHLTFHGSPQASKKRGFFHRLILNNSELMKIVNGEIRAWESIKMTFSTCREKSALHYAKASTP